MVLVTWAITATIAALVSTISAIYFRSEARRRPAPQNVTVPSSTFLSLAESAVAGRYRWTSKGEESFITLNEDHSLINKGGTVNPAHRWEITRDALVIFWLRSQSRFNKIERPGVYVELKDGIEIARMEKQEANEENR
jgi:hypothetical protein